MTRLRDDARYRSTNRKHVVIAAALLASPLLAMVAQPASATVTCQSESPAGTLSPIYTCLNGTKTLPGTNVGTVGTAAGDVDQIGSLANYNGGSGGAFVNPTNNPSIYEFSWGGGALDIEEEIGNNGTETNGLDVELALEGNGLAVESDGSLSSNIASIHIPYSSGPSGFYTVFNDNLAAGNYALDTYGGTISVDPNYQVNFSASSVPEPTSLAIFGTALLGFNVIRRRRKQLA
ncbi:MAG: PEP-CTERM sorting domain-containing protein [Stellaceae bacterium]